MWEAHASAASKAAAFLPVLEILRSYFGILRSDDQRVAREKVSARLLAFGDAVAQADALIAAFLGVGDAENGLSALDPEARQRQLFAALNRIVAARTAVNPAVILVEDLHWIDPGSAAFLENLVLGLNDARALVLCTFRPEHGVAWTSQPRYRQLQLLPLDAVDASVLLSELLGPDSAMGGVARVVAGRGGGNPFFIEEIVLALAQSGRLQGARGSYTLLARPIDELEIPQTVESVLAARIDRLPDREKALLQTAAVIGHRFSALLLARVAGLAPDQLSAALPTLAGYDLVLETPHSVGEYVFKHALVEQVAYRSQLAPRRARVHGLTAAALADLDPEKQDERAGVIAYHWEAASNLLEAARWSARAAGWAGYNDPFEAMRQWRKVRDLTDGLPESAEQLALGLGARMLLLNFAWRLGVPDDQSEAEFEQESMRTFSEGKELAQRSGDLGQLGALVAIYAALRGLGGHIDEQIRLGSEAIHLADQAGEPGLRVIVRVNAMYALMARGHYPDAIAAADQGIGLTGGNARVGAGYSMASPLAFMSMWRTLLLAHAGQLAGARVGLENAFDIASEVGDIETQGWALQNVAQIADLAGDQLGEALESALRGLDLAERTGSAFVRGYALCYVGCAQLLNENWPDAITALEQAISIWRSRRIGLELEPHALTYLARARLGHGDVAKARRTAEDSVTLALQRRTQGWELQGRLALAQSLRIERGTRATREIAAELERALHLVGETSALSLEPKVHLELAELARLQDDQASYDRELVAAQRLFRVIGAPAWAERISPLKRS